ncbi:MAG: hypothetical protein ACM3ZB_14565 [bacterium]|jgi:hypothetical protein
MTISDMPGRTGLPAILVSANIARAITASRATAAVLLIAWLAAACAASAQTPPELRRATVYSREAFLISNDKLEMAVAAQGGSILKIVLQGDSTGLSPFGNPEMVPGVPENRKFQGPMVGHFVCVDGFGSPSAEERKAGLAMHGEAYLQPWVPIRAGKEGAQTHVTFAVDLPLLHEKFTRTFRMLDGENVVYVESELESALAFDRTANWAEHPYLFPPFLEPENTVVDISGVKSKTREYSGDRPRLKLASFKDFDWPLAPAKDGGVVDVRAQPPGESWSGHTTTLIDTSRRLGFVTAINTARGYVLGYLFRREEYPWVQNYMNYMPNGWSGRGLEFATQPFDLPRREMVDLGSMFGTPVYRWLPAKSKIASRFLLFWARAPEGMRRVDDVRIEGDSIAIEDAGAGKTLRLRAAAAQGLL